MSSISPIRVEWPAESIAVVALEDRASKNSFSPAFTDGVTAAFQKISTNPKTKVVVVHGYDNYFCCGGTKEELLLLSEGRAKFTDFTFYDALLRCELPVIAAMQGHALGAGLVFGSYADLIVLGEECIYSTNFMQYGFTPGMGATCIIPKRFGATLGWEMLLTGKNYHGGELRARGAQVNFTKKSEVIPTAMALAQELADKPKVSLVELKRCSLGTMRHDLEIAIRSELEMHKVTFGQPEVRERIEKLSSS